MQNAELISRKENIFEFSASKLPGCPYQSTDPEKRIDHHRGGWMLNPGIGLQFNPEHGPCWYLSIGYNIDHSQFDTHEGTSRTIETDITYKRLMAGVGFAFSL
ncbi:hypothetical protein SAMN05443144_11065 [Fodinibius roseus]|uniref:Outer membrane protein beta-barrel domain-containing protein n=2 Tax=Fodinibius roseus TaxID=1194090 RepID=A0A1M5CRL5_9BACT|nr:hypothetical protein SAMN05443144_11065 [Fodinibius roseus]